jgi:steroid 5-alpha reductase family enzyme
MAKIKKNISFIDVAWGLGFFVFWLSLQFTSPLHLKSIIVGCLVGIWSIRLSFYLYQRSKVMGNDKRYEKIAKNWQGNLWFNAYFRVFMLQTLLLAVIALPLYYIVSNLANALTLKDYFAIIISLLGILIEGIADQQKFNFKHKNPHGLCQIGLWRYARHPNYLGEILMWWGVFLLSLSSVNTIWGIISPILLTILLTKVTGIPLLEESKKNNQAYQDYKLTTNAILPWFPKERK